MRNFGVLTKGMKNPHADAINKNGYTIKVNYGSHSKIFKSIDEYEPSLGEIAALEEFNKRDGLKTNLNTSAHMHRRSDA